MQKRTWIALLLPIVCAGCSAKDPPTYTPVYHNGTPTNRSSTNSWELYNEPIYTQPGVNGGKAVTIKSIPSQRGYEPYDPLAQRVYQALTTDATLPSRYLTAGAKGGIVVLEGTVPTSAQKAQAERIARGVPGVKELRSKITVSNGK